MKNRTPCCYPNERTKQQKKENFINFVLMTTSTFIIVGVMMLLFARPAWLYELMQWVCIVLFGGLACIFLIGLGRHSVRCNYNKPEFPVDQRHNMDNNKPENFRIEQHTTDETVPAKVIVITNVPEFDWKKFMSDSAIDPDLVDSDSSSDEDEENGSESTVD